MNELSRKYKAALKEHLKDGPNSSLEKAAVLGRRAVVLGLETLDLVKIHESALLGAIPSGKSSRRGLAKRAQVFFIEANIPIERTHLAAATAKLHLKELNKTLHQRTDELAVSKRDVEKRIVQRKAAEEALKRRSDNHTKLLKESRLMQETLRSLAHRVLAAQEDERGQISHELHDEIAQILLGINVRLLTLAQKGRQDAEQLLGEIASTQRLVEKSVQIMRRVARKLGTRHEK
jgi:two-component system, NarL family, sensor histidine kinase DegS